MLIIDDVLRDETHQYLDDLYEAGEYEVSEMFLQLQAVFFLDGGMTMTLLQEWLRGRITDDEDDE